VISEHSPNPLLPPSLPMVHASAVEAGFDGGEAQSAMVRFCWLKGEGGVVAEVTSVYVLSGCFALEKSTKMICPGAVFLEAPKSYSVQLEMRY